MQRCLALSLRSQVPYSRRNSRTDERSQCGPEKRGEDQIQNEKKLESRDIRKSELWAMAEEESVYPANVEALAPGASGVAVAQWGAEESLFLAVHLRDSVVVWVGRAEAPSWTDLALALPRAATTLAGASDVGMRIASHLQKRFGVVAFVSYNLPADDEEAARLAERSIVSHMAARMEKKE